MKEENEEAECDLGHKKGELNNCLLFQLLEDKVVAFPVMATDGIERMTEDEKKVTKKEEEGDKEISLNIKSRSGISTSI